MGYSTSEIEIPAKVQVVPDDIEKIYHLSSVINSYTDISSDQREMLYKGFMIVYHHHRMLELKLFEHNLQLLSNAHLLDRVPIMLKKEFLATGIPEQLLDAYITFL